MNDGDTPRNDACLGDDQVWKGTVAQFLARADATAGFERRRWLLHARHWLYVRERRAAATHTPVRLRLCYGCRQGQPAGGPTAGLCPRGCGGAKQLVIIAGETYETADAVHDQWFCSSACYAAAAARHAAVCAQGLRWAAAAALQPGVRVVVSGLVAQKGLNGRRGVVVAPGSAAQARGLRAEGRVRVALESGAPRPVALKYANVRLEPVV
jgi:hypothetical protein